MLEKGKFLSLKGIVDTSKPAKIGKGVCFTHFSDKILAGSLTLLELIFI